MKERNGLFAAGIIAAGMAGFIAAAPAFAAERAATPTPSAPAIASPTTQRHPATMSRQRVEGIQEALNGAGAKLAIDGIWGPKTEAALKQYQQQHGLKVTGHPDHATMKQLHKVG